MKNVQSSTFKMAKSEMKENLFCIDQQLVMLGNPMPLMILLKSTNMFNKFAKYSHVCVL